MEILYIGLALGALFFAFKLGRDAGREEILVAQSGAIEQALFDNASKFFLDTGLHGTHTIPGHENRWPPNYVVVKHTDLVDRLHPRTTATPEPAFEQPEADDEDEEQEAEVDDATLLASGPLYMPSKQLEKVTGPGPLHPAMATRRVWAYIEANGLQDQEKRTMINCDAALAAVMGQEQVSMFVLIKHVSAHLSAVSQGPSK
jgi:hypothetical protein